MNESSGYATIDPAMLCPKCEHGSVRHGQGGKTAVVCTAHRNPERQTFVVTECSDYKRPEMRKLWPSMDEIPIFHIEDGQLLVQAFNPKKGRHEFQLARTVFGGATPPVRDFDGDLLIPFNEVTRFQRFRAWLARIWQ